MVQMIYFPILIGEPDGTDFMTMPVERNRMTSVYVRGLMPNTLYYIINIIFRSDGSFDIYP